jgi:bidirectional [NiFe] hydrogenase diaphorase subunit
MIEFKINGTTGFAEDGMTILDVARKSGIRIPTLCFHEKLTVYGGCRVCLVEVSSGGQGAGARLMPACSTVVEAGMQVNTETETVRKARAFIIELLLSRSPDAGILKSLADEFGVTTPAGPDPVKEYLLERAPQPVTTNCIVCGLCVRVCAEVTERHSLSFEGRGKKRRVDSPFKKVSETCIGCSSCAYVCPTKTITVEEAEQQQESGTD